MVSQLHALLLELIPGGAKKDLSAAQAKKLLATVRPRDAAGKTRRRVAAELIGDLDEDLRAVQGRRQGTGRADTRTTGNDAAVLARNRPVRRGTAAGRGRRHHPLPRQRHTSHHGTAPPRSTPHPVTRSATGSPARGTVRSTASCTSWPSSNCATQTEGRRLLTTAASRRGQDTEWKQCAPSSAACQTSSTRQMITTTDANDARGRAREDTRGRLFNPAWPTHTPTSTLRIKSLPGPANDKPRTDLAAVS